jgi:hypothetical protein
MKTTLKKIGEWAEVLFGAVLGVAFFGYLAGALTILLFQTLVPTFPVEAVMPPADNIADWRSLVVIATGCLAILCFFLIRSLVSRPLSGLIEKSFAKWDAVVQRGRVSKWFGQFILSKPAAEEIQATQNWATKNNEFEKRIVSGNYRGNSREFEADKHALTKQKRALPSYPRLKTARKIRAYLVGIPVCLFVALILFATQNQEDADDQETADNQEAVDDTVSVQWFENPVLRQWWWNITFVCSAVGFPLWLIGSLSEKRYQKMLGADVGYVEDDDEIYVADPTSFESWRQAFIEHHGHDMSVEQEKKLRAKVGKVIDAYEQERAALRKLCEKIDEIQK